MWKQTAFTVLTIHQSTLKDFSVKFLMLFGSAARDKARTDNNVDPLFPLIEFDLLIGMFRFIHLERCLKEIPGSLVDLDTPGSLPENFISLEFSFRQLINL